VRNAEIGFFAEPSDLLIAEAVILSTVGALPSDTVAGHTPYVFGHARLAYGETASALPIKRGVIVATMAGDIAKKPSPRLKR